MTIALWCVLAAGVMPVFAAGIAKWGPGLDNNHPRDWAQSLEGYRRRAYAAHQNGFEAFPFFAAAVLAAKWADAPQGPVDVMALIFVVARLIYVGAYIADTAALRSIVWIGGWMATIAIFTTPAWAL
jgi:uncharacterized MAPEG superfamily protein